MEKKSAQIATVCECIDHCFAHAMWCEDFARHIDADDMVIGQQRAFEIVSDATRLQSYLALRKIDDFLGGVPPQKDDLTAMNFAIDVQKLLGGNEAKFLSKEERDSISKGAAHLTEKLTLDQDNEIDLEAIVNRSIAFFEQLVAALRKSDKADEAKQWLDKTEALISHAKKQSAETA